MSVSDERFWILVARYYGKEITGDEKNELFLLIESDPLKRSLFEESAIDWNRPVEIPSFDDRNLWKEVLGKIAVYEAAPTETSTRTVPIVTMRSKPVSLWQKGRMSWQRWMSVAAVIAGVIIMSWLTISQLRLSHKKNTTPAQAWIQVTVPKGQHRMVLLPDSSLLYLNAGSRLEFPARFTDSTREVRLQGEGFFQIAQDAAHPFIVRSGALTVQVLGTSFNVKAFPDDEIASVLVSTGKVGVRNGSGMLVSLVPDHILVYDQRSGRYTTERRAHKEADWLHHRLQYVNTSLGDITRDLSRHYNVQIQCRQAALQSCRFSAWFQHPALKEVLDQLSLAGGFRYQMKDSVVIISGKGCK